MGVLKPRRIRVWAFVFIGVIVGLSSVGLLVATSMCPLLAQHATAQSDSTPKSLRNSAICWTRDEPENRSRAVSGIEPVRLSDLPNDVTAKITGQLVLKLCIDTTGRVARTLMIHSSGSASVDKLVG